MKLKEHAPKPVVHEENSNSTSNNVLPASVPSTKTVFFIEFRTVYEL